MTSLQIKLWILATIALIILIVIAKTNPKLQKRFKLDETSLKKKYAKEIANGSIKLEPQSDKHFYKLIFIITFASLTVLFAENYFVPYLDEMSHSCELIMGIDLFFWFILIPISYYVIFCLFFLPRYIKDYRDCLQTGYSYKPRQSNLLVKVFKKESKRKIVLKIIAFCIMVLIMLIILLIGLINMNNLFIADSDKKIVTMQLIKEQSLAMQKKCLTEKEQDKIKSNNKPLK